MRVPDEVGYLSGVFDILHIEHLRMVEQAAEHCDVLLIGVLTDEVCRELTGADPVNPYDERLEIVRALRPVHTTLGQVTADAPTVWNQLRFARLLLDDEDPGLDEGSIAGLPDAVTVTRLSTEVRSASDLRSTRAARGDR